MSDQQPADCLSRAKEIARKSIVMEGLLINLIDGGYIQ